MNNRLLIYGFLFVIFVILCISSCSSPSLPEYTVTLKDWDIEHSALSLQNGKVQWDTDSGFQWSLMFDSPHGLGMNNKQLEDDPDFTGSALICDMGLKPFDAVKEAPTDLSQYSMILELNEIIENHIYCIVTEDGVHYGKIQVITFDGDEVKLKWVYQPNGTNRF
jgi:hypothetical protein